MEEPRVGMVGALVFVWAAHGDARLARRLLQLRHPFLDVLRSLVSRVSLRLLVSRRFLLRLLVSGGSLLRWLVSGGSLSCHRDQHQLLEDRSPLQQVRHEPPLAPCPPEIHNLHESQLAEDDLLGSESDPFIIFILVGLREASAHLIIAGELPLQKRIKLKQFRDHILKKFVCERERERELFLHG